mmetsp:Transcript_62336/g.177043  ORF Transcript_62336/g.177043 Transcript_62336/m.177043 type:complete len:234 (+) Transcript_62336:393-1094(+)
MRRQQVCVQWVAAEPVHSGRALHNGGLLRRRRRRAQVEHVDAARQTGLPRGRRPAGDNRLVVDGREGRHGRPGTGALRRGAGRGAPDPCARLRVQCMQGIAKGDDNQPATAPGPCDASARCGCGVRLEGGTHPMRVRTVRKVDHVQALGGAGGQPNWSTGIPTTPGDGPDARWQQCCVHGLKGPRGTARRCPTNQAGERLVSAGQGPHDEVDAICMRRPENPGALHGSLRKCA